MGLRLSGFGSAEDSISGHGGEDNLADDLGAGLSDDKSVLLGVVLVLVLAGQPTSGEVVGLSLSPSLWLYLHSH